MDFKQQNSRKLTNNYGFAFERVVLLTKNHRFY